MSDLQSLEEEFSELKPLHQKHNEMLQYINDFCQENDINWCLAFGSALGARRHGGPIPWDDDVDIQMPLKDYEKFRKLFWEKGDRERFYLQEMEKAGDTYGMSKLRMNGTAVIEELYRDQDIHQGIYVDIFTLNEAPPTGIAKARAIVCTYYLLAKSLSNRGYSRRKLFNPVFAFLRLFPKKFGILHARRVQAKWEKLNSDTYADWSLYTSNPKWFIPKEDMFPAETIQYDNLTLKIPRHIDKYLTQCYGDWQKIPSVDKIKWAHHAAKWSTTEDFRNFAPNIKDFSDETL